MKQYLDLLQAIKDRGTIKSSGRANMPNTTSLFGYQFRHNLQDGIPLLTTKKMFWKGIVEELLWFLNGDTNIKYLIDRGVNIWNEDAYQYYQKIAKVNGGKDLNAILQPVSTKEPGTRTPKPENVDGYSMFFYEEFIEKIKTTTREELPKYQNYILGDCGYQYGRVWRRWEKTKGDLLDFSKPFSKTYTDQITNVIKSIKTNPESRRHIVTAIDPAHESDLALYWCHAMFQFNCRKLRPSERADLAKLKITIPCDQQQYQECDFHEKQQLRDEGAKNLQIPDTIPQYYLDCQLFQRSADVVLGVPFNIASYSLLTHIIAKICNMVPGEYIHTFGDVHIYDNHMDAVNEQLKRTPGTLPTLKLSFNSIAPNLMDLDNFISMLAYSDFQLVNYNPQSKIEAELSTGLVK